MDINKKGAEKTHLVEIIQNLNKIGDEITLIAPRYCGVSYEETFKVEYIDVGKKGYLNFLLYHLILIKRLKKYLKKHNAEVIYLRSGFFDFLVKIFKPKDIKLIGEINGIVKDELYARGFNKILVGLIDIGQKLNYNSYDKIICVTEGLKDVIIKKYNIDKDKLFVINNGANTDIFKPMDKISCRSKLGLRKDLFYVGFVGSFAPWQGLEILVKAAIILKGRSININYIIVGDGEMESHLKKMVKDAILEEYFIFTGRIPYQDVPLYINGFDVATAPFSGERNKEIGLSPLKLCEYMACEIPVIAGNISGVTELVLKSDCGLIFEYENSSDLADKITYAYDNPQWVISRGAMGRKMVEQYYSWEVAAKNTHKIIEEMYS